MSRGSSHSILSRGLILQCAYPTSPMESEFVDHYRPYLYSGFCLKGVGSYFSFIVFNILGTWEEYFKVTDYGQYFILQEMFYQVHFIYLKLIYKLYLIHHCFIPILHWWNSLISRGLHSHNTLMVNQALKHTPAATGVTIITWALTTFVHASDCHCISGNNFPISFQLFAA